LEGKRFLRAWSRGKKKKKKKGTQKKRGSKGKKKKGGGKKKLTPTFLKLGTPGPSKGGEKKKGFFYPENILRGEKAYSSVAKGGGNKNTFHSKEGKVYRF